MSDEYSLAGRFLMGKDSAARYEYRLARLRAIEAENEATLDAIRREASESSPLSGGRVFGHGGEGES